MLRSIKESQEVMIAGWTVPMPVIVRSRPNEEFVQAIELATP
jgi:hypothetical protein